MFYKNNTFHYGKNKMQEELDSLVNYKDHFVKKLGLLKYKKRRDKLMNEDMVSFRKKYKKKYGNMEIYSLVNDVKDSYNYDKEKNLVDFDGKVQKFNPMFIEKKSSVLNKKFISTPSYNLIILGMITALLNIFTLFLLAKKEFFIKLLRKN
ncbi:MAG: hypothetical protein CSA15_10170 [Candidatus Delongbacteria bacterium]|nr:MAG: hypothetical protein CSA15_10170 [Candidatus Delongbacteria bacterium]